MTTGHLNPSIFLKVTEYLGLHETDYVAWYPMIKAFEYMSHYFPYPRSAFIKVNSMMNYLQHFHKFYLLVEGNFRKNMYPGIYYVFLFINADGQP
jgi:hypothetical protein